MGGGGPGGGRPSPPGASRTPSPGVIPPPASGALSLGPVPEKSCNPLIYLLLFIRAPLAPILLWVGIAQELRRRAARRGGPAAGRYRANPPAKENPRWRPQPCIPPSPLPPAPSARAGGGSSRAESRPIPRREGRRPRRKWRRPRPERPRPRPERPRPPAHPRSTWPRSSPARPSARRWRRRPRRAWPKSDRPAAAIWTSSPEPKDTGAPFRKPGRRPRAAPRAGSSPASSLRQFHSRQPPTSQPRPD